MLLVAELETIEPMTFCLWERPCFPGCYACDIALDLLEVQVELFLMSLVERAALSARREQKGSHREIGSLAW